MISVCIPIYNYDVTALVQELSRQAGLLTFPCEIVLIDDASSEHFKQLNRVAILGTRSIELKQNVGRAKIRNLFLEYATYPHFLFLDCDSLVIQDDFLKKYAAEILQNEFDVICGGRVYNSLKPERTQLLSWKYGFYKESQPAEIRQSAPNRSFMTNNFLIKREILSQIKFDERIVNYGHEDTLFGFMLSKNNIRVHHINNAILNGDIETNKVFLAKTEQGIINLLQIVQYLNGNQEFLESITLLRFYKKIKSLRLISLIRLLFYFSKPLLKSLFTAGIVNLTLFDFYKLGILCVNTGKHVPETL